MSNYVRDGDRRWVAGADSPCGLGVEIVPECVCSFLNFARAASSAALCWALSDNPDGLFDDVTIPISSRRLQPESWTFASTRHFCLISAMALSVV